MTTINGFWQCDLSGGVHRRQDIVQPAEIKGKELPIAPGERYDIEFIVPSTSFMIYDRTDRPAAKEIQIPVQNQKKTGCQ